jgi:DNA-binding CsgD family transcriptional regulator
MTDDKELDQLIGLLYETVIDPSLWGEAMELCARYAGGIAAHMLTIDKQLNQPIFSVHGGEITNDDNASDYANYYINLDPRIKMIEDLAVHDWWFCHAYFDQQFVNRSEFYQDFLIPNSARYSMGACVDDDTGRHTVIGLMRTAKQSAFGEAERSAAKRFSGHLQRALRLQNHTQTIQTKAATGARAIDALALAMVIVNGTGTILHLNNAAETLLNNQACSLNSKAGRLSVDSNPISKYTLVNLISGATGCPAVGGAMFLSKEEPRQVFVTPLPAASLFAQDWQTPLALVVVMDTNQTLSPMQLLGKLYDLSPAELRIASALLEGKSLEEYSQEAGVTMNTVRTQLKNLFRKTGTHRQPELVTVLRRVPPLRN